MCARRARHRWRGRKLNGKLSWLEWLDCVFGWSVEWCRSLVDSWLVPCVEGGSSCECEMVHCVVGLTCTVGRSILSVLVWASRHLVGSGGLLGVLRRGCTWWFEWSPFHVVVARIGGLGRWLDWAELKHGLIRCLSGQIGFGIGWSCLMLLACALAWDVPELGWIGVRSVSCLLGSALAWVGSALTCWTRVEHGPSPETPSALYCVLCGGSGGGAWTCDWLVQLGPLELVAGLDCVGTWLALWVEHELLGWMHVGLGWQFLDLLDPEGARSGFQASISAELCAAWG